MRTKGTIAAATILAALSYIPIRNATAQETQNPQRPSKEETMRDSMNAAMQSELLEMFADPTERKYISSGKTPEIMKPVRLLLRNLGQDRQEPLTIQSLLDNSVENMEFVGVHIDEGNPFRPKISIVYLDPTKLNEDQTSYEPQIISFSGGAGNRELPSIIFAGPEVVHMRSSIREGRENANMYNSIDNKVEKITQTLDIQAGKVPGKQSRWTPRFENQMGFQTEEEMRQVIGQTNSVTITYEPHDPRINITIGDDFKVTYELKGGRTVTKYTSETPLRGSIKGLD